jgi:hypothetical protein
MVTIAKDRVRLVQSDHDSASRMSEMHRGRIAKHHEQTRLLIRSVAVFCTWASTCRCLGFSATKDAARNKGKQLLSVSPPTERKFDIIDDLPRFSSAHDAGLPHHVIREQLAHVAMSEGVKFAVPMP